MRNLRAVSIFSKASLSVAVVLSISACVSAEGTAKVRAANDFQCAEDQVNVTNIGGTSFRASGCGKTAVYNCAASDASKGNTTAYACVPEAPPAAK